MTTVTRSVAVSVGASSCASAPSSCSLRRRGDDRLRHARGPLADAGRLLLMTRPANGRRRQLAGPPLLQQLEVRAECLRRRWAGSLWAPSSTHIADARQRRAVVRHVRVARRRV